MSTDLSEISYSGYLLKRSNQPYDPASSDILSVLPIANTELPLSFSQRTGNSWSDSDSPSYPINVPLHLSISPDPLPLPPMPPTPAEKTPIEQGLDIAAAFFGIQLNNSRNGDTQQSPPQLAPQILSLPPNLSTFSIKRSAPIKVGSVSSSQPQSTTRSSAPIKMGNGTSLEDRTTVVQTRDSFQESMHRNTSAPVILDSKHGSEEELSESPRTPPVDFIDPRDGHIWRAKYCVLEESVLYFYRNPTDGESPEAIAERRRSSSMRDDINATTSKTVKDLSKSPMPRAFHHLDSAASVDSECMWEKRVCLDSVGAVRSAEQEYGDNSFELVAVNDEDDVENNADTLVLQARNQGDMKEWLFQFHRSLASVLMNLMDAVGHKSSGSYLNIIHPTFMHQPPTFDTPDHPRGIVQSFSPRFHGIPPSTTSLSHGHGRSALHRRRVNKAGGTPASEHGTSSLSSTPETGRDSPLPFAFRVSPTNSPSPGSRARSSPLTTPDRFLLPPRSDFSAPELSGPQRYIPPSMRKASGNGPSLLSLAERAKDAPSSSEKEEKDNGIPPDFDNGPDKLDIVGPQNTPFKRGGCADPQVIDGSILDVTFIPKKASNVGPVSTDAFGCYGGGGADDEIFVGKSKLRWETGAVSVCGIRDSNEDAYLIASDLIEAFQSLPILQVDQYSEPPTDILPSLWTEGEADHKLGLFALFDGHCGNHTARFATERLAHFIHDQSKEDYTIRAGDDVKGADRASHFDPSNIEQVLRKAITKLDKQFCDICMEGGREWESGATALVAVVVNEHLVIANLGDCRGVICRSVEDNENYASNKDWSELDTVGDDWVRRNDSSGPSLRCFWKEVTNIHSPSVDEERSRIEEANGWVTTETEIPIGQLRRMDFLDEDVVEILKRCFYDQYEGSDRPTKECKAAPQRILEISRVCGELAVSRALGDRDFKAAFNSPSPYMGLMGMDDGNWWDCSLFLPYPDLHNRQFQGDLVSSDPEFQNLPVGEDGVSDEFLLLACDGLWDVMDVDDAVRVIRDLLFRKKWTAKKAVSDCEPLTEGVQVPDEMVSSHKALSTFQNSSLGRSTCRTGSASWIVG
jgi:serine/threonine protein phosphatase PrpC